jgi:hypothetical protein
MERAISIADAKNDEIQISAAVISPNSGIPAARIRSPAQEIKVKT